MWIHRPTDESPGAETPGAEDLPFRDRADAGQRLAARLSHLRGQDPLVLAIPRGAVPMGRALAEALGGELDVVLVHKIGAPFNPELAIGAVDETGRTWTSALADEVGASPEWIREEALRQQRVLEERRRRTSAARPPVDPAGRVVVVVDDGVATGATMAAALEAVRARKPARLVAATPVASQHAVRMLGALSDEVVCLHAPEDFMAISQFYRSFGQVSDEQVMDELRRAARG